MTILEYVNKLRDEGLSLRIIWEMPGPDDRFKLACYQVFNAEGEWMQPIIIQEFDGGRDGIMTYRALKGRTITDDVPQLVAD